MDPNAALKNIREAVGELRNQDDDGVLDGTSQVGFLLESVEALDEWLTKGGFLPTAWQRTDPLVDDEGRCEHGYFLTGGTGTCPMPREEHTPRA